MNEQPLVSIVTPMFNSEMHVSETINSVLEQTYTNWELIVVDDGSTDNSCCIVEEKTKIDQRIKLYKRDRLPKGVSTSRNVGIDLSTGQYLMFLDSDDLLYTHCIENRLKVIEQNPTLDFAVFQMSKLRPDGIYEGYITKKEDNYLRAHFEYRWPWQTSCPLWKTAFFKDRLVGFDENFSILEDPELHTRALLIDNVAFEVYHQVEYTDCAYRIDYKPKNIKTELEGAIAYIKLFVNKIQGRKDEAECRESFLKYYETILAHYSGQTNKTIFENISIMKQLNFIFLEEGIVNKRIFRKTNWFLNMHKHKLFNYKLVVAILKTLGFTNFYYYVIGKENK